MGTSDQLRFVLRLILSLIPKVRAKNAHRGREMRWENHGHISPFLGKIGKWPLTDPNFLFFAKWFKVQGLVQRRRVQYNVVTMSTITLQVVSASKING